jgi:signal peptidase I
MENTIMTGDRIICNRLAYIMSEPQRYDIISFYYTEATGERRIYVKRIIGLPGETLEIIDGKVYINGQDQPLPDDFVNPELYNGTHSPFEIPDGHYFVLGDNRARSFDSKGWPDPYLPAGDILGTAMFQFYPSISWLGNA